MCESCVAPRRGAKGECCSTFHRSVYAEFRSVRLILLMLHEKSFLADQVIVKLNYKLCPLDSWLFNFLKQLTDPEKFT